MLKIYDKLWYVLSQRNRGNLSYMTYYKDDSAFRKRMGTGLSWAGGKPEDGNIIDNDAVSGFRIDGSTTRWTTQNKLFRVTDPRGFTVEIPAGNLAKIIACTTITNGEIMDECIWGREGQDHLLIPKKSELFEEATLNMEKLDSNIKIKDVAVGEIIEMSSYGSISKMIYLGKFKGKFKGELVERSGFWNTGPKKVIADLGEHTDKKWWHALVSKYTLKDFETRSYFSVDQRRTVNVTSRTGQKVDKEIVDQLREKISYADSSEARNEFRKYHTSGSGGIVDTDFVEGIWNE